MFCFKTNRLHFFLNLVDIFLQNWHFGKIVRPSAQNERVGLSGLLNTQRRLAPVRICCFSRQKTTMDWRLWRQFWICRCHFGQGGHVDRWKVKLEFGKSQHVLRCHKKQPLGLSWANCKQTVVKFFFQKCQQIAVFLPHCKQTAVIFPKMSIDDHVIHQCNKLSHTQC